MKEPKNNATIPFLDTARRKPLPKDAEIHQLSRQRWQDESAKYVYERRIWQKIAFISLGVNILAIIGMAWVGSQTKIIPYVVEVDKMGVATAVQRVDTPMVANAASIKAHLARWIENTRSVYTDMEAEKRAVKQAYSAVNNNGPAYPMLNEYFTENQPFKRAANEAVTVSVESVQPISEKTWRIEWQEEHRDRNGGLTSRLEQQATVTLVINPPTDEPTILVNPLGIYIDSFSWSQRV